MIDPSESVLAISTAGSPVPVLKLVDKSRPHLGRLGLLEVGK